MTLVVVSAAALATVLFLQRGLDQWQRQSASSAQKEAFYLAEAGLAEALDALRVGSSGNVGTKAAPALFGDGGFWVEAVTDDSGVTHLVSTGLYDGHAYRLDQAVAYPRLPLASEGFFGATGVILGDGAEVVFVDAADDAAGEAGGPIDGALDGLLGGRRGIALPAPVVVDEPDQSLVGSNGSIELGLDAVVDGALTPGPDGLVGNLLGALLGGSTTPASEERPLPEVAMPMIAEPLAPTFTDGVLEIGGGAYGYEAIRVTRGRTLRLVGPVSLSVPSLEVLDGGAIEAVTDAGEVRLFVDEHLVVDDGAAVVNTLGDAARLLLVVDGRTGPDFDGDGVNDSAVQWRSTGEVRAALYAPHAPVALPAGAVWRGALTALELAVGDGARLELDRAVNALELRGRDLVALSWRTLPIPPAERAELANDPIARARRDAVALVDAADARIPAATTHRFTADDGSLLTYLGATLDDLTTVAVDALEPAAVARPESAPEFAVKERSGEEKADLDAAAVQFRRAWSHAVDQLTADWVTALETGKIPGAAYRSVVVDGVLVEPIASTFADPIVRDAISGYLASSGLPNGTIAFLEAGFALMP